MAIEAELQAQVDAQLMEQGAFAPLDLLFNSGRLIYGDYEAWRRREIELLDDVLMGDRAKILAELERAAAYARSIGLVEQPQELHELTARIERLRERLKQGDTDMPADEIQAAIDRAAAKRNELRDQQQSTMPTAKMFTKLPRAAEAYRRQITLGLDGDPRAALKARSILRELFGGKIRLVPQLDGGLVAHRNLHPGALLKALGTYGSGGRI